MRNFVAALWHNTVSHHGPILHRFRDVVGLCAHDPTPILRWFWGVPDGPGQRPSAQA